MERLRPLDAVVWELQPPSMMTLQLSFGARPGGDTPTFDEYLGRVQRRLEPREIPSPLRFLRQRIRRTGASLGDPFFEDDPGFDVRHHVRRAPLEAAPVPADRLAELMIGAMSRPFGLERPLWRVDVVDAVSDGSFALYITLHHAMGDGLFGLTVASFLALDDGETDQGSSDQGSRWVPERTQPPLRLAMETLGSRARGYAGSWGATAARARRQDLSSASAFLARMASLLDAPKAAAEGPHEVPSMSQRSDWRIQQCRLSLLDLRIASRVFGVTIMDLLLAGVAAAWSAVEAGAKELSVSVPVSLRRPDDTSRANLMSVVDIALPCGGDLLTTLRQASATLTRAKQQGHAQALADFAQICSHLPLAVQRGIYERTRHGVDVLVSNLPGLPPGISCLDAPLHYGLAASSLHYQRYKLTFASFGDSLHGTLVSDAGLDEAASELDRRFRQAMDDLVALARRYRLLSEQPHFVALATRELDGLCRSAEVVSFGAGQRIVSEGDRPDAFFVVKTGTVTVTTSRGEERALGPGDSFGEVGLIRDGPRAASVDATDAVELLRIPGEAFLGAVSDELNARPVHGIVDAYVGATEVLE